MVLFNNKELVKRFLSSILIFPLVVFIIFYGSILFNLFLLFCFCIAIYEWTSMVKKKLYYFAGIIFLIFSFYLSYKLYNLSNEHIYFIFVLLVCISTDIGGFMFGKIFKGPKLTSISPNKTYMGMFGGFILSIVLAILFFQIFLNLNENSLFQYKIYILAILISSVSQLGDIVISYFKRIYNVKDTGNIIPGHGGLLDRIDGMIFAFPFSYIVLSTNIIIKL
tara:strand:+ start:188 stop:853 length:666 start_codon:yes stop_codon:yes gene_type:complete